MNGKGSARRPMSVSWDTYSNNFENIFKKGVSDDTDKHANIPSEGEASNGDATEVPESH